MNKLDNRPFELERILPGAGAGLTGQGNAPALPKTGSPVVYADYADRLQNDVDRIRQDWTRGSGRVVLYAVVPILAVVFLTIFTTLVAQPGSYVYWIGKGLLLLVFAAAFVKLALGWKQTARSIVDHSYLEVSIKCPHCQHDIDLTLPWRCGWCGVLSNESMLSTPNLVFDGCSHKGKHRPNAIRCSHCSNDIIRDSRSYVDEHNASRHSISGVAEFIHPPSGK